jgi:predicted nucleotide-binding protein
MAPPVADQEFVVHLFAPLEGPAAAEAYRQVQRAWAACREVLGMTERVRELGVPALPPATPGELPADGVAACQQSPSTDRQSVLRREHDVLNLSVGLAQPVPEGPESRQGHLHPVQPSQRPLGWTEFAQLWARANSPAPDAMLGEAHLFLARMPQGVAGPVEATAELGQALDPLLPYREDRPGDWWRWGTTTVNGYAVWDTRLAADTGGVREVVVVAGADQQDALSAWAWSDRTPGLPPFARYLMHAAKLQHQARLLSAWHAGPPASELNDVLAELNTALAPEDPHPGKAALLRSRLSRLRAEESRLANLHSELDQLRQTAQIARNNLRAVPGCADGADRGMFAADQDLAQWLIEQASNDLSYLDIDLRRVDRVRALAAEELGQVQHTEPAPERGTGEAGPGSSSSQSQGEIPGLAGTDISRRVFVVHGRDSLLVSRFKDLLYVVNLRPLEWEQLVAASGSTAPYLGQLVAKAPRLAQTTLVLLSPDDVVELHSDLGKDNDMPHEQGLAAQARPNVLLELGMALMAYPERTIVVEIGRMRPVGDLGGLNVIRFDGSSAAVKKVLDRLHQAGCPVDYSGPWLDPLRFADLDAYRRGPQTHHRDR